MFDYFTFRTSAAADSTAAPDEVNVSPTDSPSPQRESASPPAPSPTASSIDLSANPSQVPSNIENLVRSLRRQNLELEDHITQPPYFPSSPALSDMPSLQPWPEPEIDDQLPAGLPSPRDERDLSSLSLTLAPSLTVDEVEPDPAPPVPDTRRLRRQLSSHFNNNPANAPAIHALARGLAESGSQCNVRTGPPLTPMTATRLAPIIEPDDDLGLLCVDLEVDEAYCAGNEEITWLDNCMSLRRASTPGGIRKNGVLRYRLSLDAALRCNNVVRSRPRMRKRKRPSNNLPNATPSLASSDSSPSLSNLAS